MGRNEQGVHREYQGQLSFVQYTSMLLSGNSTSIFPSGIGLLKLKPSGLGVADLIPHIVGLVYDPGNVAR